MKDMAHLGVYNPYQLFKFIGSFRYLGIEDLPQEFFVEISSVNVEFFENKTGEGRLRHT